MEISLKPHYAPLPDAREMGLWDAAAAADGVSPERLMENAGRGALLALRRAWAQRAGAAEDCGLQGLKILLFMGKGNNGGDAAVLARLCLREGAETLLCHVQALPEAWQVSDRAAYIHLRRAVESGVAVFHLSGPEQALPFGWDSPDIIVDGLLGTGFTPPLRPDLHALIERINRLSGKTAADTHYAGPVPWGCAGLLQSPENGPARPLVLALDIPSGLCARRGTPSPAAVRADLTVTFEAPKMGLLLYPGQTFTGRLLVHSVGIPVAVQTRHQPTFQVLLPGCAQTGRPLADLAHKGRAGRVLIIGGSAGLTGAPHLSALGALRAGAGLARLACPAGLNGQVKYNLPDLMTAPLGNPEETAWRAAHSAELLPELSAAGAVVLGPGLGLSEGARGLVAEILAAFRELEGSPSLLLDADALNILAENPGLIELVPEKSVFTPHPGEAARLLNCAPAEVEADRPAALTALLELLPGAVLLKGAGTLLGHGQRRCFLPFVEPNLAVGGSGDVLSGIISAYLAQGVAPLEAACAGAYVHGLCGGILSEAAPERGNLASDIAAVIPRARALATALPPLWLPSFARRGADA